MVLEKFRRSSATSRLGRPSDEATSHDSSVQYPRTLSSRSSSEPQVPAINSNRLLGTARTYDDIREDAVVELPTRSASRPSLRSATTISSLMTVSSYPLGLNLVYGPPNPDADIIFVHGLGGSAWKTWSSDSNPEQFWPAWVPDEDGLAQFRIFSYGYDSKFRDGDNPSSILDFAKGLLLRMKAYTDPDSSIGKKPLVFVAHSMGGLVVKKALIIGKNDDNYALILSKVHGIMFLSTPHKGSRDAHMLNSLLSLVFTTSAKVYVSELETGSTSLEDMSEQFRAICSPWHLISLYESRPTKLTTGVKRLIVGKDSGVLNYPSELSSPIDADHQSICKYQSRSDPNYKYVVDLLRQLVNELRTYRPHTTTEETMPQSNHSDVLEAMLDVKSDSRRDVETHLRTALPESGQWLFNRGNFQDWLYTTGERKMLLLVGLPGSGKSTLAAKVVSHIQRSYGQSSCQYHFFDESQPASRSAAFCLRSIIWQLAQNSAAFAARLAQLHRETGFTCVSQKFAAIWAAIFEDIVFKMVFDQSMFWIFDGLDECDTPKLLLDHLVQLQAKSCIKILVMSRPKRELENLVLSDHGPASVQKLSIEDTRLDIEKYIDKLSGEVLPTDRRIREEVVSEIMSKAEGSFLWTKLALESLRDNWHTEADIMNTLQNVPSGMENLYQKMMDNVNAQKEQHRFIALRILTWISFGHRPLTIEELSAALKPEFEGFTSLADTLVQICGHFVRIDHGRITLIHSTARQFLFSSTYNMAVSMNQDNGHDHLAAVCLEYLSQSHWRQVLSQVEAPFCPAKQDRLVPLYNQYPLLHYALNHWAYHVRHSRPESPKVTSFLRLFCNKYILNWIHAVALANDLHLVPSAARELKAWLRRTRSSQRYRMNSDQGSLIQAKSGFPELAFVEDWAVDLIRLPTAFGSNLLQLPSSIYRHIPPFCPAKSITARTYSRGENSLIAVSGLQSSDWNDKLVLLSLNSDEMASKIRCAGIYFLTLSEGLGVVTVYSMDTCVEVRKLRHTETINLVEASKTGKLVATAGRHTFRIWDLNTGQQLHRIEKLPDAKAKCISFGRSDDSLLVGYDNSTVVSYNFEEGIAETLLAGTGRDAMNSCANFMELSPDLQKVAIAFRGRPLLVWNIRADPGQEPRTCVRSEDKDLVADGEDFNSVDRLQWSRDSSQLFILYQDTTLLRWHILDDEQDSVSDTDAKELILSPDGTHLLTSDSTGSISLWGVPKLNLVYNLHCKGFVRDLTFSRDGQYILDVRSSSCNVWAPYVLARREDSDRSEAASSHDGSIVSETVSEPIYARDDQSLRGRVTALDSDGEGEFFSCGRNDGSVCIHSMLDGGKLRKVSSHALRANITTLKWSASRRYLASADNFSRVIVKKLKIKEDGKWAVFPVFDTRANHAVTQLLFSPDDAMILISTRQSDIIWDLKRKERICQRTHRTVTGRRWLNHPARPDLLIWIESDHRQVYRWEDLMQDGFQQTVAPALQSPVTATDARGVLSVAHTSNRRYVLYETPPIHDSNTAGRQAHRTELNLIDLNTETRCRDHEQWEAQSRELQSLRTEVQRLLGCHNDRIVFLNHSNWICTCSIKGELDTIKRHFFLPRNWVNAATLQSLVLTKQGTLLCERDGDVAIVQYLKGL